MEFDTTAYNFGWNSGMLGTAEELQLYQLIGVEYDPARGATEEDIEKWEALLGEMTKGDFHRLFSQGLRKTLSVESIGKPGTNDQNASNGFEWAFNLGDAMNVMIAFNELGDAWTGSNYNLMTGWLRGEAGMAGFALSDWYYSEGENIGFGILAGACLLDGDGNGGYSAGVDPRYDNRLLEAATRILYTVANSNAMNFWGDGTETHSFDPLWYTTRENVVTATTVVFAVCCAFLVITTAWTVTLDILASRKKSKKK